MADPNIGQVASVAWENLWASGPVDSTFTSQALLFLLKDGGYREYADGGRLFEVTVEYAQNSTFRSISEMEALDTSRIDVFDAARYEQKIHAGTVVFSDLEELRNAVANRQPSEAAVAKDISSGTATRLTSAWSSATYWAKEPQFSS